MFSASIQGSEEQQKESILLGVVDSNCNTRGKERMLAKIKNVVSQLTTAFSPFFAFGFK
jgi:hypothetical protein